MLYTIKAPQTNNKTTPSNLLIVFGWPFRLLFANANTKIVIKKVNGLSKYLVSFLNFKFLIIAHIPKINNKLDKLLPITLPIAISEYPFNADVTLINNSGIEVPIDTIVNPITISGIWNLLAILLPPFTKKSAPFISKRKPIIIKIVCIIIFCLLIILYFLCYLYVFF